MSRKNAERNGGERATILEQEGGWAVVLTRDGEFRRLRLPAGRAWQVGDELALPEPAGAGRGGRRRLWAAAAVAAALLLVVLGTLSPWSRPTAWAYVSLDWHGGVEFTTDRDGRVIDARAFSTAGAELLRDVAWRGRPIDQVLAQAAEKEIQDARTGNDAASAQGKASPAGQPPTPVLVGIAPARQGASPDRVEKRVRSGAERLQGLLQSQAADVPVMLLRVEGSLAADRDRVQSVGASQAWAEAQRHLPGVRVEPGWAALFRQLLSQGLDPQRTIGGQLLQGVLPKEGGAPSGKEGREAPATGPAAQAGLPAGAAGSTRSGHPGEEGGTGQPGGSAETGAAHPLPPPVGKPPQGADAAGKAPFEPGRSRGEPASVRGPSSGRTEKGGTGLPSLLRQGCQPRLEGARQLVGSCPEAEPRPGGKVAPPQGGREEAGAPQRSRSGDASWKGLLDRLGSLGRQLEGLLGAPPAGIKIAAVSASVRVDEFDYELPEELIAQEPLEPRDGSRLMVLDRRRGRWEHARFRDLAEILQPGDCLVLNDTRVRPARLIGRRDSGGRVELLLLRPLGEDRWEVLGRPARKLRAGSLLLFGAAEAGQGERLEAEVLENRGEGVLRVRFRYRGEWERLLERLGQVPLPPYIRRPLEDPERYQTVYAREPGSAAAPTAGLHFTPELLERLRERGVEQVKITLHVGIDTFRPVLEEEVERHRMHAEFFTVSEEAAEAINRARAAGGRRVAVGTTVVRTLESVADPQGRVRPARGWTDLFIYPGYRYRAVDALLTNFHLPRSTLLMLVSAFAGRDLILAAYREAVGRRYRFFSFGDAMLIL